MMEKQQEYLRRSSPNSPHSPGRPPSPPPLEYYPWETKITPPHVVQAEERARREQAQKAKEALLSPEQKEAMAEARAIRIEAARAAAAEKAERARIAAEKAEAEAQMRALAAARAKEVTEAGDAAAAAAATTTPRTAKDLIRMRDERMSDQKKKETDLSDLKAVRTSPYPGSTKEETLKRRLGDAIIARGVSIEFLLHEWDKSETDAMGIHDFREAIRLTLPALKGAPNDTVDDMFHLLDEFQTGLILGLQRELTPLLRKIVNSCSAENAREKTLAAEIEMCAMQKGLLDECIEAAEAWSEEDVQLHKLRAGRTLETKLGLVLAGKLSQSGKDGRQAMGRAALAAQMGAVGEVLGKEEFINYVLTLRMAGEFKVEENERQVAESYERAVLSDLFDKVAKSYPGEKVEGDEVERVSVLEYLAATSKAAADFNAKDQKILAAASKAEERSKALQVNYAKDVARKEKEIEIDGRGAVAVKGAQH